MVADNDMRILTFLSSDTPISKLLNEEIPAVTQAKKDLEQLVKRQQQALNSLERENKKLERMQNSINSKAGLSRYGILKYRSLEIGRRIIKLFKQKNVKPKNSNFDLEDQ